MRAIQFYVWLITSFLFHLATVHSSFCIKHLWTKPDAILSSSLYQVICCKCMALHSFCWSTFASDQVLEFFWLHCWFWVFWFELRVSAKNLRKKFGIQHTILRLDLQFVCQPRISHISSHSFSLTLRDCVVKEAVFYRSSYDWTLNFINLKLISKTRKQTYNETGEER